MCLQAKPWTLGAWYVKPSLGAKNMLDVFSQPKVTNEVITEAFTAFFKDTLLLKCVLIYTPILR